jgi:hypothetical protein
MDTSQKIVRLREIAEMIEVAAKGIEEIAGDDTKDLARYAERVRDRAKRLERQTAPIAVGDDIEVRGPYGYQKAKLTKVTPLTVSVSAVWQVNGKTRYSRDLRSIHPDDLARLDACFPRKVKP